MLNKAKFRTYDRSAVNGVRVTSCSANLGQKYGFAGIAATRSFLQIKTIGKDSYTQKRMAYITAISDFGNVQSFETFEIFKTFFLAKKSPPIPNFQKPEYIYYKKLWISGTFLITYHRHVCEPILIKQVSIDREWKGYSHR